MGHLGWLFKLNPHPRHQHCTDEAQKAETVLSAVSYIYIYIYIYIGLIFVFSPWVDEVLTAHETSGYLNPSTVPSLPYQIS